MSYEALITKLEKAQPSYYVAIVPYNPTFDSVLLGHRREDGIWTTPAGGANRNESPEDCAVRECWEEAQLEVDKKQLIPIGVKDAPNGKPVHCFAYVTHQYDFSISSDPDREVPEWKWHNIKDLPSGLSRQKNQNRLETINEALMYLKGLKKSGKPAQIGEQRKHRDGSVWEKTNDGWVQVKKESQSKVRDINSARKKKISQISNMKGKVAEGQNYQSMLESMSDEKLNSLHSKLVESQPQKEDPQAKLKQGIKARQKDMNEGASTGQKTKSGKDIPYDIEKATAAGFTPEDHRDAMNFHFDTAGKMSELITQMREKKMEIPEGAVELAKQHRKMSEAHSRAAERIESRRAKMKKSVTSMGHGDGLEIDTAQYSVERDNCNKDWLERLFSGMAGYEYGDVPREFDLDKGKLFLSKVDDGVYSGFFRMIQEVEDGQLEDNSKVRIERQTLPTLVNFLTAKEWILTEALEEIVTPEPVNEEQIQALNAKLSEIEDGVETIIESTMPEAPQVDTDLDKKIRMLELMNKLLGS